MEASHSAHYFIKPSGFIQPGSLEKGLGGSDRRREKPSWKKESQIYPPLVLPHLRSTFPRPTNRCNSSRGRSEIGAPHTAHPAVWWDQDRSNSGRRRSRNQDQQSVKERVFGKTVEAPKRVQRPPQKSPALRLLLLNRLILTTPHATPLLVTQSW